MEQERKKFLLDIEKQVCTLREMALEKVHKTNSKIPYIVDRNAIDDYWDEHFDYPGRWFSGFKWPGPYNQEEIIETMVNDTIKHFARIEKALEIVHKINPTIPYIIDNYSKDDYWVGSIDPNSRWYPCYKFPSSDNEETFIENLVSDTLEHFKNYKTIVINISL